MTTSHAKREVLDELIAESRSILDGLKTKCIQEESLLTRLLDQRSELGDDDPAEQYEDYPHTTPQIVATQSHLFEPDPSLSIPAQIEKLLEFHDAPMRAADIARKLTERGVETTSDRGLLPQVLSALSRKTSTFSRVQRGIYGLTAWNDRNGKMAESA